MGKNVDEYILRDSGERDVFESGMVRDSRAGKGRYDLISPIALRRLAIIYEKGALKYSPRNWEKGAPMSRFLDSALRHLNQFKEGYREEDHLAQSAWNIFAMMHFEELRPDLNDLPDYRVETIILPVKRYRCKTRTIFSASDTTCKEKPCEVETSFTPKGCLLNAIYQEWEECQPSEP